MKIAWREGNDVHYIPYAKLNTYPLVNFPKFFFLCNPYHISSLPSHFFLTASQLY